MKEYLNENTLYATLAMYLSESEELALVVEGPDDHLMLKEHCSPDLRLFQATGGKGQVLDTASIAQVSGLTAVRFLVDQDYDQYCDGGVTSLANVFISEQHDCFLDIAVCDRTLLTRVIEVHTDSARRRPGDKNSLPESDQIRHDVFELATLIAALRIVDARRGLSLTFRKFSFGKFTASEITIDIVVREVLVRSSYAGLDVEEIIRESTSVYAEIVALEDPPIGDHDLFKALAWHLKNFNISISQEFLQKSFILAVDCSTLKGVRWFIDVQKWCASWNKIGFNCQGSVSLAA